MFHHTHVAFAALAFSTLVAALGNAHAAGVSYEASSSLSNLQYTLTDLRPDDGVAASVSFNTSGNFAFVGGLAVIDDLANNTQVGLDTGASSSPFNASASTTLLQPDNTYAGGFVSGNTLAANVRLTRLGQSLYAEGAAVAINIQLTPDLDDTVVLPIQDAVVLAPHSQLTLTALAKYSLVRLGEGDCEDCAVSVEVQSALIGSEVFPQFFDPALDDGLFDQIDRVEGLYDAFGINRYHPQGLPDESRTKILSLTFVNDSDEAKRFGFIATTWAQAQTTPAVPEPETWALTLSGLLLVAAARRRSLS